MAITQSRVIAILNAAQDYEQALTRAIGLIRVHASQAKDGVVTWQQAMETTVLLVSASALLTRAITTNKTLASERQHFKDFARRNERAAIRMAQKRGASQRPRREALGVHQDYLEFVPQHTTAPREIAREGRLYGSLLDDVDAQQRYAPDPSLAEDDEWAPPEPPAEATLPSTLDDETKARIDREAEAAVQGHPGLSDDSGDAPAGGG